jgi:hypothetical protein
MFIKRQVQTSSAKPNISEKGLRGTEIYMGRFRTKE